MANPTLVFSERMTELEKGKFILSESKIRGVLKCIAATPELLGLIKECLTGFDFDAELKAAKQPVVQEYSNRYSLRPPADKKKFIAFVFCLLAEFDDGKRDLNKFLQEYFYEDGSVFEAYKKFIFTLIKPFRKTVESLFKEEDAESEEVAEAEKYFDGDNTAIDNMMIEDLIAKIQDVSTALTSDDALNLVEKREMIDITEGLGNAIITREARLIKLLWIGFKNTIKSYKALVSKLGELEARLKEYRIID